MNEQTTPESNPAPNRDDFVAELNRYTEAFGADHGSEWFKNGDSFEQALQRHCDCLQAENEELKTKLAEAEQRLADVQLGEAEPVDVSASPPKKKSVFRFADPPQSDN